MTFQPVTNLNRMSSGSLTRRRWITAALVASLTYAGPSAAAEVDGALQGVILGKALSYVQTLQSSKATLLVVATGADSGAGELAESFRKVGVEVRLTTPGGVDAAAAKWADAAYIYPGHLSVALRELCTAHRMLSISASVGEVEAGRASMAVGIRRDKPQLVINLPRATAEGHKFSARLLKLARIVD